MRKLGFISVLAFSVPGAPAALAHSGEIAAAPSPPAAAKLSVNSTVGELLADARTRAVLEKYIPAIVNNPMIAQAAAYPFAQLAAFPGAGIPEETLRSIDAELGGL